MKIVIIGAMDAEIEKFVEIYDMKLDDEKRNIYISNNDEKEIVVAKSGIGKVNAASMTQYLIDKYSPDYIINSGCAGSLVDNVKILDIAVSTYVTYHDFLPVRIMNMSTPDDGKIKTSEYLRGIAHQAASKMESCTQIEGPFASGDSFVTNEDEKNYIRNKTNCIAVDMESAPIAHVCRLNNVPFIAIRTISDNADGIDDFEEIASHKSSELVKNMIEIIK